jgi:hypothetical protein
MPSLEKARTGLGAQGVSTPHRFIGVSFPSLGDSTIGTTGQQILRGVSSPKRALPWPEDENSRYCKTWLIPDTNPPSARNASLSASSPELLSRAPSNVA